MGKIFTVPGCKSERGYSLQEQLSLLTYSYIQILTLSDKGREIIMLLLRHRHYASTALVVLCQCHINCHLGKFEIPRK